MKLHIRHLCLPLAIVAFLASSQKSLAAENQQSGTQPQSDEVSKDKVNLVPKIHGTVRARWEMDTKGGENRFAVRNARVSISGEIAQPIDYYIQTDFCDQGKMKILDAWGVSALPSACACRADSSACLSAPTVSADRAHIFSQTTRLSAA